MFIKIFRSSSLFLQWKSYKNNISFQFLTPRITNSYCCCYIINMKMKTKGPWATSLTWETNEYIFLKFANIFSLFCYYLPLEKGEALHLNKLESPSSKDTLCQVWLKLTHWFWRRKFLKFINVFSLFHNYLPLEKGRALHF